MQRETPRQVARRLGEATYFTGHACSRLHISPRYTATAQCVECVTHPQIEHPPRSEDEIRADLAAQLDEVWRRQMQRWSPE